MLPEQGRSPGLPARSRAGLRRHGAAASSARTWHPGYLTLPAGCGYSPALVATAPVSPVGRAGPWPPLIAYPANP